MSKSAATVEACVEQLLHTIDGLCGAVLSKQRNPMDVGMRAQYDTARSELREAIVALLMLIDIID